MTVAPKQKGNTRRHVHHQPARAASGRPEREQGEVRESTQRELRAQRPSPFHGTETKRALPTQHSATPALGVLLPISSKARPRVDWGDRIKDQLDEWTVVQGRGSAPLQV